MRGKKYESYADALKAYAEGKKIEVRDENADYYSGLYWVDGGPTSRDWGGLSHREPLPWHHKYTSYYEHLPEEETTEVRWVNLQDLERELAELKEKLRILQINHELLEKERDNLRERVADSAADLQKASGRIVLLEKQLAAQQPKEQEQMGRGGMLTWLHKLEWQLGKHNARVVRLEALHASDLRDEDMMKKLVEDWVMSVCERE